MNRLAAFVRLVHPFPSLLDGVVVIGVALLAGSGTPDALRLGLAMVALQAGIGATNDLVDASADAGHKPGKPIPAGLVSRRAALILAVTAFAVGIALAVPSGPAVVGLAAVVVAIGLAYDLRFKGTAWSWLPFAVGIPILPVFGWFGGTGALPPAFAVLVPAAVLAGAALAISNSLADVERDRAAGTASVALALGPERAWVAQTWLLVVVVVAAAATAFAFGGPSVAAFVTAGAGGIPLVGAVAGRGGGAGRRERAWEIEAIGIALLALAWAWAVLV